MTVIEIMPYAALQFGLYDAMMKFYSQVRVSSGPPQARVRFFSTCTSQSLCASLAVSLPGRRTQACLWGWSAGMHQVL